jgi:phage-related protein
MTASANIFSKHTGAVLAGAGALAGLIVALKIADQWENILKIRTVAVTVAQNIAKAATFAWTVATKALGLAMRLTPLGLIITGIAALIAIIVLIATKTHWFQNIWHAAWGAITGAASATWNWIKSHWPLILGVLTGPIGLAIVLIVRNFDKIKNIASSAFNWGKNIITSFVNGMKAVGGLIVSTLSNLIPGPIKSFLHLGSPAKEGPMSEDGGPEHWGEKVSLLFTKGLAKGARGLPGSLGGLTPGLPAFAAAGGRQTPSITINAHTNASAADIGHELAWALRTSGR